MAKITSLVVFRSFGRLLGAEIPLIDTLTEMSGGIIDHYVVKAKSLAKANDMLRFICDIVKESTENLEQLKLIIVAYLASPVGTVRKYSAK